MPFQAQSCPHPYTNKEVSVSAYHLLALLAVPNVPTHPSTASVSPRLQVGSIKINITNHLACLSEPHKHTPIHNKPSDYVYYPSFNTHSRLFTTHADRQCSDCSVHTTDTIILHSRLCAHPTPIRPPKVDGRPYVFYQNRRPLAIFRITVVDTRQAAYMLARSCSTFNAACRLHSM